LPIKYAPYIDRDGPVLILVYHIIRSALRQVAKNGGGLVIITKISPHSCKSGENALLHGYFFGKDGEI
jgi:hypothetical protein